MDEDDITPGTYNADCDLCLYDRHYCEICQDVVYCGHSHSD